MRKEIVVRSGRLGLNDVYNFFFFGPATPATRKWIATPKKMPRAVYGAVRVGLAPTAEHFNIGCLVVKVVSGSLAPKVACSCTVQDHS